MYQPIPLDLELHPILLRDPELTAARDAMAAATGLASRLDAQRTATEAEQKRLRKEALDRGEVFTSVIEIIPTSEVRAHADAEAARAIDALEQTLRRRAAELIEQLEATERELLEKVPRAQVADLGSAVAEMQLLRRSKALLVKHCHATEDGRRFSVPADVTVTAGSVVDAAVDGSSLIGQTPPAPPARERTPVFAKGLAQEMSHAS